MLQNQKFEILKCSNEILNDQQSFWIETFTYEQVIFFMFIVVPSIFDSNDQRSCDDCFFWEVFFHLEIKTVHSQNLEEY